MEMGVDVSNNDRVGVHVQLERQCRNKRGGFYLLDSFFFGFYLQDSLKKTREKRCHSLRRREYYIPSLSRPVMATVIPEVLL
jgi:hypothetical protein